jgi:ribosomal protein S9
MDKQFGLDDLLVKNKKYSSQKIDIYSRLLKNFLEENGMTDQGKKYFYYGFHVLGIEPVIPYFSSKDDKVLISFIQDMSSDPFFQNRTPLIFRMVVQFLNKTFLQNWKFSGEFFAFLCLQLVKMSLSRDSGLSKDQAGIFASYFLCQITDHMQFPDIKTIDEKSLKKFKAFLLGCQPYLTNQQYVHASNCLLEWMGVQCHDDTPIQSDVKIVDTAGLKNGGRDFTRQTLPRRDQNSFSVNYEEKRNPQRLNSYVEDMLNPLKFRIVQVLDNACQSVSKIENENLVQKQQDMEELLSENEKMKQEVISLHKQLVRFQKDVEIQKSENFHLQGQIEAVQNMAKNEMQAKNNLEQNLQEARALLNNFREEERKHQEARLNKIGAQLHFHFMSLEQIDPKDLNIQDGQMLYELLRGVFHILREAGVKL